MKDARLAITVSSILVLALAASAIAVAKPKAEFKPKVGDYLGTATAPNSGTIQVSGQVAKEGRKYIVQVLAQTVVKCADGSQYPSGVGVPAQLKGRSFSNTESGKDSRTGGTATYKISGSFSNEKTITGTASKEVTAGSLLPEVGACSTGTVKFTLHLKG